ncbi:hypothetical protein RS84_00260 [Microbacterium hydrocarbonoxydans]|uniref:Uncharacterized protein n=1 Tax=Microbacterium hydrocarbonoxydans TaxID=273678 RepID=A0A0M2HXI5_9MICO|nr:hypothetical protein [Microbacterium hydrocarbonoxydans]KJL49148.1 hypothetical protein RS84_00260 [Microbacterium hydrocarbonoxydans]
MNDQPSLHVPAPAEILGVTSTPLTDEQDIAYNVHCTAAITERLLELRAAGAEPPLLRTFYPNDDEQSADLVSLDRDGCVVVLDPGNR